MPKDIKFYDPNRNEFRYIIDHDNPTNGEANDFYPIVCLRNYETTTLHLKNDGTEVFTEPYCKERVNSITDMKENFLQGKHINQYQKLSIDDVEDSDSSHYYSHLDLTEICDQTEPVEHTDTEEISCSGGSKNAFQLDMELPNSWYQLIPEPVHFKTPK